MKSRPAVPRWIAFALAVLAAFLVTLAGPSIAQRWSSCCGIETPDLLQYLAGSYALIGTIVLGSLTLYQNLVFQRVNEEMSRHLYRPVFSVEPLLDRSNNSLVLQIHNASEHPALDIELLALRVECGGDSIRSVQRVNVPLPNPFLGGTSAQASVLERAHSAPDYVRVYIRCKSNAKERCMFCAEGRADESRLSVRQVAEDPDEQEVERV